MDIRIKFLGAAGSVTGSKYLLEIGEQKVLVDCGLFQGLKELRARNWNPFPIEADQIDAVVLTHAHIDHSGYLPRLVKEGFKGTVHCTAATQGLLEIMLLDAAKLQEEETKFARKKGYSKHENPIPLFNTDDANSALQLLSGVAYGESVEVLPGIKAIFRDAGHILGSSIIEMEIKGETQTKKLVFSGDLGRYNRPMLYDPVTISDADILLVESTYGDRNNDVEDVETQFADLINEAIDRGGCLLIPAFAVGRTQLLLHYIKTLMEQNRIPEIPVYVDSPMAISTTKLYQGYTEYHKLSQQELSEKSIFDYPAIKYYRSQEASNSLNNIKKKAIIISASGMCTGGRILHHLYHRLPRENDTVLIAGYQAEGTRGRKLLEGEPTIRMFGLDVPVKCHVSQFNGLSAHADKSELIRWLGNFKSAPKMTFIVHGEVKSSQALQHTLKHDFEWQNVFLPAYLESFDLFQSI